MQFSIVLASRDRTRLLINLIESIKRHTVNLDQVEVLVGVDQDDQRTQNLRYTLHKYHFVKFFVRQRSHMLNEDYLNWITRNFSRGKYIIICNDDTVFRTDRWDERTYARMEEYLRDKPDGIAYGYFDDGLVNRHGLGYCCFPLVTRRAVNALGFAMPPQYPAWGADVALWKIFSRVDRICDISEVTLDHLSQHNGTRVPDAINKHVQNISNVDTPDRTDEFVHQIWHSMKNHKMTILEQAIHNYDSVMLYHKSVSYNTNLDTIWSNNLSDIYRIVNGAKDAADLINRVDQSFMYSINFPPENGMGKGVWMSDHDLAPHVREKQIDWCLKKQKDEGLDIFGWSFGESEFIHERNKVVRNGKTLSGNFMKTASIAHRIFQHLNHDWSEIKHILELGAGCGHQARTFLNLIPGLKYTIIDLPETLLFSFTHLSLCFPDKKILFVTSPSDIAKIDDHDIAFVPAVFAEMLSGRSYDLFVNTASMGEMTNSTIHRWMDLLQNRVKLKYLYTLNRYLNVVNEALATFRRNENECSTSYDHKWNIVNWELEPVYCRCPYIDTLHSRYVEIFATRPEKEPENLKERSQQLLEDALAEDWYRLKGMYDDGLMQGRSNVLVNDMTMTGTLFKLWESIRLDQNVRNVSAMLEYLNRIIIRYTFEEVYYYEDLLSRLQNANN